MSTAGDILLAGDAVLIATHSMESVIIASVSYSAFVMESTPGNDLELGGFSSQNLYRLAIPRALFPTALVEEGDAVTFRTLTLYALRVQTDDAEAPVTIDIGPNTSRRAT